MRYFTPIKKALAWTFLLGVFFLMGCEEEIDLNLPDQNKLVVLSNFTPDSLFRLFLSSNAPIGDNNQAFNPISNARIQLFENGNYLEDFVFENSDDLNMLSPFYFASTTPRPEVSYSIIVSADGYPEATANTIFSPSIDINSFNLLSTEVLADPNDPSLFNYQINAQLALGDLSNSTGFFHLRVWRDITSFEVIGMDTFRILSIPKFIEIPIITTTNIKHLNTPHEPGTLVELSNDLSSNSTLNIDFMLSHYPDFEVNTPLYLELQHVSEDYYRFHESVGLQENANLRESILSAQAIPIYNNIEDGIGNFSGYSAVLDSLIW